MLIILTFQDGSTWYSQSHYSELTGVTLNEIQDRANNEELEVIEIDNPKLFNPSEHFILPGLIVTNTDTLIHQDVYKRWLAMDKRPCS